MNFRNDEEEKWSDGFSKDEEENWIKRRVQRKERTVLKTKEDERK